MPTFDARRSSSSPPPRARPARPHLPPPLRRRLCSERNLCVVVSLPRDRSSLSHPLAHAFPPSCADMLSCSDVTTAAEWCTDLTCINWCCSCGDCEHDYGKRAKWCLGVALAG